MFFSRIRRDWLQKQRRWCVVCFN